MLEPLPFRLLANPRCGEPPNGVLPDGGFRSAKRVITCWDGYAVTPLHDLPELARDMGVGALRLKDEATRFGLGSFKALGGAYAVALAAAQAGDRAITVACATDGNHGRAVAWGAQRFGCRCVIFVHEGVSQARVDAIARYGADVRRVRGTYDDSVREATRQAEANGWLVVSDTAWDGYTDVPREIMQGYRLMAHEAADQWSGEPPTHVFVQAGVGGVAAAVSVQMRARFQPVPALIVVEPDRAACLLASAEFGTPTTVPGNLDTLMAGLACGEPSLLAWRELDHAATAFMAIPDEAAAACMRLLSGHGIVAGESGAAGLAGCLLAAADLAARGTIGLDERSRVLAFSTEGATDPALYQRLTGYPPA
ncbi:MAG TPA: diaminopropionate ammonia-lyase [Acetobacteraceae bacterium]|nr:diaminopropionate ammonia-lyase [Acetobacteraceae bacterium]